MQITVLKRRDFVISPFMSSGALLTTVADRRKSASRIAPITMPIHPQGNLRWVGGLTQC
jgi:hypothetical protein